MKQNHYLEELREEFEKHLDRPLKESESLFISWMADRQGEEDEKNGNNCVLPGKR